MALEAGLDVELPSVACYGSALVSAVQDGAGSSILRSGSATAGGKALAVSP